jgi:hypothetical protein
MTGSRAVGIFGILAAVLFTVGVLMLASIPVGGEASSDEEIREFYGTSGDRSMVIIGMYLLIIGMVCFVPFLAGFVQRSRIAEGGEALASRTAQYAGIAFAVLAAAGACALAAVAGGIGLGDEPADLPDTGIVRFMAHAGYALVMVAGALMAAGAIAAASWVIVRTRWLPAWTGWLGFGVAAVLLAAIIFVPLVALPAWLLVVSVVLLLRGDEPGERGRLGIDPASL